MNNIFADANIYGIQWRKKFLKKERNRKILIIEIGSLSRKR